MNQTTEPADPINFDVREISCREKHALIFERWAGLPVGAHFVLINDHDPVPLYYQFAAQFPDAFEWEYLVAGPDAFHVKITRTAVSPDRPAIVPPTMSCGSHRAKGGTIDVRGLEPPEPMTRILLALEKLTSGSELRAITERRPVLLYPELQMRGARFASEELGDGSWLTTIVRV
ncbi:MAG TPA: DUF2249 domain-containing protein [Opitutaceae bacterium]|nr:DUF2249 domain-containing protein [Opitutaceae bacterium]